MNLKFTVDARQYRALLEAMGSAGRQVLHTNMARDMAILVRQWLKREAGRRHTTANRLGATPTGHLTDAAQSGVTYSATPEEGAVDIASPGIGRALRQIKIVPRLARALTIPLSAEAYGRSAGELERDLGITLFRPKGKRVLMGARPGEKPKPHFALAAAVTLPQDRSLLPPDEALAQAARNAFANTLHHRVIQGK